MARRQLRYVDYNEGRFLNYYPERDFFSTYWKRPYIIIELDGNIAGNQNKAREDYKENNGRVLFYEELYDWE